MTRLTFVWLACVSLTAFACGGEPWETGGQEATGQGQAERTSSSDECPPDWPGPWTACPEAEWVRQVAEHAGYRITAETGSALSARGQGWSFYVWATEGTREEIAEASKRERWQTLDTVEGVTVYGDESLWRWWVVGGFVVWLQAGPYEDSRLPPLAEMDSLVRASRAVPPPD